MAGAEGFEPSARGFGVLVEVWSPVYIHVFLCRSMLKYRDVMGFSVLFCFFLYQIIIFCFVLFSSVWYTNRTQEQNRDMGFLPHLPCPDSWFRNLMSRVRVGL